MTWFDLVAFILVALAVIDGARSGLAWAALEFALLLSAALLAGATRPLAEPYVLKVAVLSQADLPWVTHALLFAFYACVFMGIAFLLHPMAKKWRFRHDAWLGGLCGVLNGALAALVLFALAVWNSPRPYEDELHPSVMGTVLVEFHDAGLNSIFPAHLPHRIEDLREP